MKLLVVHPLLNADHPLVQSLQSEGAVVLLAASLEPAKKLLQVHGAGLSLAVLHRELGLESGLDLISVMRLGSLTSKLPCVVTSDQWSDADFARHQSGPDAAHAYLPWKRALTELRGVVEQVLGMPLSDEGEGTNFTQVAAKAGPVSSGPLFTLEEVTPSSPQASTISSTGQFRLEIDVPDARTGLALGETRVLELPALQSAESMSMPTVEQSASQTADSGPHEISLQIDPDAGERAAPIESHSRAAPQEVPVLELSSQVAAPVAESFPAELSLEPHSEPVVETPNELPYSLEEDARAARLESSQVEFAAPTSGALPAADADGETLRRHIVLREQEHAALKAQLLEAREHIRKLDVQVRQGQFMMDEQNSRIEAFERREKEFEREKLLLSQGLMAEIAEMKFQRKVDQDKVRLAELQRQDSAQESLRLKERFRADIRKVQVNERELQNRVELLKRDTDAVLRSRESTIMELKRKLDTAEFNLDLMQERLNREKETAADLREKLLRASQAVRVAEGLLDHRDVSGAAAPEGSDATGRVQAGRKVS